ncbi:unnamed protein product [Wuchereria bancrofti]|uniref:EF-hand domain-containing protein n=1 Tax=Wuchereria bancrofti TaxID=6293 RepID=A0A3P7DR90_WUCBA|nr:unnamed protein product [Wuchereria bancrofti]
MGIKSSKPKLSKEDLDFLKKNTSFTEEQIKEWYKGFVIVEVAMIQEGEDVTVTAFSLKLINSLNARIYFQIKQDCPKGHLTKDQFIKVYKDFFPSGSAEGFCEHVFRTFDTDNSGFIDFKEFLLAINVTSSGTPEQKLEWAFRMYDIDGNGTIDEKEMIKIIEAIYEMLGPEVTKSADDSPRKRAKMIFEKMDVNNDKELTLKEFVDGCLADKELFQILTNEVKK